jgi:AcrR family transcriptional regulator
MSTVGRPKLHDEDTARALLAAAERAVEDGGLDTLSLRAVADEARTTTRAVYSLFGSKDGLIAALGARTFGMLAEGLNDIPVTRNPRRDLVEAALMFRRFAVDHPALFALGIQRTVAPATVWQRFRPHAADAFAQLTERMARLERAGLLRGRSPRRAAGQFHALCEGLAALELRGVIDDPEPFWREAISALIAGFAEPPPKPTRAPAPRHS